MLILAINSLYNEMGIMTGTYIWSRLSGGVALTCSSLFLCPALLGIVFHVSLLQEF